MSIRMAHLELKKKLRGVGLYGDAFVNATGSTRQELKATLLIVGRHITLATRQEITAEALSDLGAVSVIQRGMLLDLLGKLLARPSLRWNEGPAYDAWREEHGAAAFTLHETKERHEVS